MTDHQPCVSEEELHAFADGLLPPERQAAVEAWLASHPEDRGRIAAWRAQAQAIRACYAVVASEPIPARLTIANLQRRRWSWGAIAAAALIAAFLAGGAAGWTARGASAAGPSGFAAFMSKALEAHSLYVVEVRHPVEVPGNEKGHLAQWLSKRLGYALRIPDLDALGLKLVGGRLLPGPHGPAAFLMYENASGERFTLYCARASGPQTAMRYYSTGSVGALYWSETDAIFVLTGASHRDELYEVARAAYTQIEQAPGEEHR